LRGPEGLHVDMRAVSSGTSRFQLHDALPQDLHGGVEDVEELDAKLRATVQAFREKSTQATSDYSRRRIRQPSESTGELAEFGARWLRESTFEIASNRPRWRPNALQRGGVYVSVCGRYVYVQAEATARDALLPLAAALLLDLPPESARALPAARPFRELFGVKTTLNLPSAQPVRVATPPRSLSAERPEGRPASPQKMPATLSPLHSQASSQGVPPAPVLGHPPPPPLREGVPSVFVSISRGDKPASASMTDMHENEEGATEPAPSPVPLLDSPQQSSSASDQKLTCAVCLDKLYPPVNLCPDGHIYHEHCLAPVLCQREASCPLCRCPLRGRIRLCTEVMEALFGNIKYPCPNTGLGCPERALRYDAVNAHRLACSWQPSNAKRSRRGRAQMP